MIIYVQVKTEKKYEIITKIVENWNNCITLCMHVIEVI
jgi:hypothetical protein